MIVADRKPFEEILDILGDAERILVSACNTCVTVCLVGGRREAALLASQLRIHAQEAGRTIEVRENSLERHCDREFLDALTEDLEWADVMLSTACGVGVNLVSDVNPTRRIAPAVNTTFLGATDVPGRWPCGGSQEGNCEVDKETPCAWQDIIERLDGQGRSAELEVFEPIKDWRPSHAGGRRRRIVEEVFAGDPEVSE